MTADQNGEQTGTPMAIAGIKSLTVRGVHSAPARHAASPLRTSVQYVPAPTEGESYSKSYTSRAPHLHSTNFDKDHRVVEVHNARLAAEPFQLHQHGFTLAELDFAPINWRNADEVY